jgi:hypothetical protein
VGEPLTVHPAADRVTAQALVVEQARAVVPLSSWLATAAVDAHRAALVLQLVTPADAVLTHPLELLLREGGGQWVARDGDGFRDGFTGAPLAWDGERFVPADGPVPDPVLDGRGGLEVQITTLHDVAGSPELGAGADAAVRALTGAPPTGWGVTEPVTEPWSPAEITALCRARAPEPTSLVVLGGGPGRRAVGRLRAARVREGVLEEVRLAGPTVAAVGEAAVEELVAELAGTVRSAVLAEHPVRIDGQRPARPSPPALPLGVLVGHPVLVERGVDHARRAPAGSVRVFGRRSATPGCWCRFTGDVPVFEQLTAVLRHFGLE